MGWFEMNPSLTEAAKIQPIEFQLIGTTSCLWIQDPDRGHPGCYLRKVEGGWISTIPFHTRKVWWFRKVVFQRKRYYTPITSTSNKRKTHSTSTVTRRNFDHLTKVISTTSSKQILFTENSNNIPFINQSTIDKRHLLTTVRGHFKNNSDIVSATTEMVDNLHIVWTTRQLNSKQIRDINLNQTFRKEPNISKRNFGLIQHKDNFTTDKSFILKQKFSSSSDGANFDSKITPRSFTQSERQNTTSISRVSIGFFRNVSEQKGWL